MKSIAYNIIFAGTPQFSVAPLQALIASEHKVVAVYTQPDRPAGRGRKLTESPVKEEALKHQLPIFQPQSLKNPDEQQALMSLQADLMIVVAYGLILPKSILQAPRFGCLNIHASLLPRWRGAAPIQRAIEKGDAATGITIMQMNEGLDTGDMLYKVECPIEITDTSDALYQRLSLLGTDALMHTLTHLSELVPAVQDSNQATYAHKITKNEAEIDWNESADVIARKVRAFNPWPIMQTHSDQTVIRIWEAEVIEQNHSQVGEIIAVHHDGIDVATSENILRIKKLQLPGGRVLPVFDIVNAKNPQLIVGKKLGLMS